MNNGMTDYDTISETLSGEIVSIMHCVYPHITTDNSIAVNRDELLLAVVRLARLERWIKGLAETHRQYAAESDGEIGNR